MVIYFSRYTEKLFYYIFCRFASVSKSSSSSFLWGKGDGKRNVYRRMYLLVSRISLDIDENLFPFFLCVFRERRSEGTHREELAVISY
jgi:hypothetical protein